MTQTWKFGGTDLSTFGAITLLDDSLDFVERRGQDQVVPYRHGAVFVEKYFSTRTIAFGITIKAASVTAMQTALDTLRKLIAPRRQQTLEFTLDDATVRNASAIVNKALDIKQETILLARLVLEFSLANPLFRLSTVIADNTTTINANPKAMTVTNPGTVEERDPTITLTGPLSNTVITNATSGSVLTYNGTIAGGETVSIATNSLGEYTALKNGVTNVIGNVTHSGSAALMVLEPGANTLSIADATHTTGTVKISFYAPFL